MIEVCFKCNGHGANLVPDKVSTRVGGLTSWKSETCHRCKGAGAVDYQIVTPVPVTANPLKKDE